MAKVDVRALERRFGARRRAGTAEVLDRVARAAGGVRGLRVLDVGCGAGDLLRRLARGGADPVGIDPCPGGARIRAEGQALPFARAAFDLVVSSLVLHYLPDPPRMLDEIRRVLRPGGRFLLCDRIGSPDPVLRAAQMGIERLRNPLVRRIFSAGEIETQVRRAGFEVERGEEFRRREPVERWLGASDPAAADEVRGEIVRLKGRDLGGIRAVSPRRLEIRLFLIEARNSGEKQDPGPVV